MNSRNYLEFSNKKDLVQKFTELVKELDNMQIDEKVNIINKLRFIIHQHSPFKKEPIDYVVWVKSDKVQGNDYNPNVVAPPEMGLLTVSIDNDGYTQPIVSWENDKGYEVVDGFHRNKVGKECKKIKSRIYGYLPITLINKTRSRKDDRIASTIRHNRARGKHTVLGMSDIILELKNRNWTDEKIARQLGMDQDEILKLCQITGLAKLFSDQDFSKSWDIEDLEIDNYALDDNQIDEFSINNSNKEINTTNKNRIFHTYDKWECYKAGFYKEQPPKGMTREQCEEEYMKFLSNNEKFSKALQNIITKWKNSCEHYLTNNTMNRIAWLGQASMCYVTGIPAAFRSGFNKLSEDQQVKANEIALKYLNKWLEKNNLDKVTMQEAL